MSERFDSSVGCHFSSGWLASLDDEELAGQIRKADSFDSDLLRELCWRADLIDEWEASDWDAGVTPEDVAIKAAKELGVDIGY